MDTAVYLQIALLAYFCLIICHMARYDKTFQFVYIEEKKETCNLSNALTFRWSVSFRFSFFRRKKATTQHTLLIIQINRDIGFL